MTVKRIVTPEKFIGLSTDTKSTHCRSGATFYEYDTDRFFITYDEGGNWVIKKDATNEGAWTFGQPVLRCAGAGRVGWTKDTGSAEALFQKGTSGYLANLYGGVQDSNSWAAVYIPVNELPVPAFESALWTYRLTSAESAGVNLVVWVHDPTDNDKRAEITQVMGLVDRADGWNAHELDTSVSQFFFYGEGESGNTTCTNEGTNYTWDQYQADAMFSTWTIYRISLEYGWIASSTLDDAWVCDVKLNGQVILLKPRDGEFIGRETKTYYEVTATDSSVKVEFLPAVASRRIRVKTVYMANTDTGAANFEMYFGTGGNLGTNATKAIALMNLASNAVPTVTIPFGDNGPLGGINEAISIRTSANITDKGIFIIVYNEE